MSTLQNFFADAIPAATNEVEAALISLPEDKRNWKAGDGSRSALDMMAEIAVVNASTVDIIVTKNGMIDFDLETLERDKAALCADWDTLKSQLDTNTTRVAEAVRALSDEDLNLTVQMPRGPMPMTEIIAYPYWNAKYHEGQINFIASMLGSQE